MMTLKSSNMENGIKMEEKIRMVSVDELLTHVGEYGRLQKLINCVFCIMTFPPVYQVMISYFTVDGPDWKCAPNSTRCRDNGTYSYLNVTRCKHLQRNDWVYDRPVDYSVVTQFDLSCEKEWLKIVTTSVLFIGWIFGSIVLGYLSDNFGRKLPLFVAMTVILVFGFLSAFMPNIFAFMACRFIIGFFLPASFPQMFLYISEVVGDRHRAFAGLIIFLFAGIALSVLGLKAYFIPNWKILYIVCTAPYIFVLAFYSFIPESVRYLRVKGKVNDAMVIFRHMAKWNGTSIPPNVSLEPPPAYLGVHKASPVDLFRTRVIAYRTIIQGIGYFVGAMTFFGVYLAASDISGHMYRDYILVTVIEIPMALVMMDFTERFGRKRTVMTTMLVGSLMCCALGFTPTHLEVLRVIFGMIGKVSISANCNTIQTWTVELYPTSMRGLGMGFTQVMSRVGAACAPFIDEEMEKYRIGASFIFMGMISFLAFFMLCFLPEMKGVPTSDGEEEATNANFEVVGPVVHFSETAFENPLAVADD